MKRTALAFVFTLIGLAWTFGQTATAEEVSTKKVTGKITEYISSSEEVFKVGDTIQLGRAAANESFDCIYQNAGVQLYPLKTGMGGNDHVVIKRMKAQAKQLNVNTTAPAGGVYGLVIQGLENAIAIGEVKTKQLSSDDALAALKKEKDKLDLGLITQEEYEARKADLVKFIK